MEKLKPPLEFPFPFTPYTIQMDFMKALYTALEEGKLGIFESPTGTGKSLSLICGALTWLKDHETRELENLKMLLKESDEKLNNSKEDRQSVPFNWLAEQSERAEVVQAKAKVKSTLDTMSQLQMKLDNIRQQSKERKKKENSIKQSKDVNKAIEKVLSFNKDVTDGEDNELLLEEYAVDTVDSEEVEEKPEDEMFQCTKIYFCSRTHSQLAQFVNEVRRSSFASSTRLVPLASRQNYCINNTVKSFKNLSIINERCLDLQKKSSSKVTAVSKDGKAVKKTRKAESPATCFAMNRSSIEILSQDIVSEVQDVEQIVKAGTDLNACPYYASRASVAYSQVVVIPYNTLLHKSTREACGIILKDNVIIIDEAHNLLESIGNIHSTQINGYQLLHSHSQLVQYRDKYQARFKPSTLLCLNQVVFIVGKLIRMLGGKAGCDPSAPLNKPLETNIFTLPDLVVTAEIDNLNLFKLLFFCKSTKLCQKLHGFSKLYGTQVNIHQRSNKIDGVKSFLTKMKSCSQLTEESIEEKNKQPAVSDSNESSNNPFLVVMSFLESLTNDFADGRVLIKRGLTVGKGSMKFLLLNPAAHFQDIIRQSRSVIVAGGTMEPISEFQNQLFVAAGASIDRILHFSCGHIIPPENILPIVLGQGPSGKQFDFSYTQRDSSDMIKELGRLILNICNVVPAGLVIFFPSYEYEQYVIQHLEKDGIITQIENKKKIFHEPKNSGGVEETLSAYASCINQTSKHGQSKLSGALLFSVIGGKLSEGINFSDDLGRCVIVVGLPFPNIKSVELQEQMKFLDMTVGSGAGQSHYENLCMKAVNQSVGRAVRHKDDYAAVLLIDKRYLQESRQSALPSWIQRSLQSHNNFGSAFRELSKFFRLRRSEADTVLTRP